MNSVTLINPKTKEVKIVKIGFSWTTLFFGIFVPIFRLYTPYILVLILLCFLGGVGIFVSWFIAPFFINKHYYHWLLSKGFMTQEELDDKKKKEQQDELFQKALLAKVTEK